MNDLPHQVDSFLSSSAPFDSLDKDSLARLAKRFVVFYLTEENKQAFLTEHRASLFLIQSGQFVIKDSNGPEKYLSEGDFFGYENLLENLNFAIEIDVDNPGLIYCLPQEDVQACLVRHPSLVRFFENLSAQKLQNQAVDDSNSMWLYQTLSEVIRPRAVTANASLSIHAAARLMTEQRVSSLLITDDDALVGILTDRDMRSRVVAKGTATTSPVSNIMTGNPVCITASRTLFDALCVMAERNIHHLPVVETGSKKPVGMLSATDMIRHQRGNILFLIHELSKATNLYELSRLAWQLPHYFSQHAHRLGDYDLAGKALTQATDIMTRKLLSFFHEQHGDAPMDYCWLVYGSQAREDQTMGSDQDNALLLERDPDEQQADYFAAMADYVCQGLAKCGIKLCGGNIMACNPDLRMSVAAATATAEGWVNEPTKHAIMHFNIFLDVRAAAGSPELLTTLQRARAPLFKRSIFLAALARHINEASVPLSMFQKFIYAKDRAVNNSIDLKVSAVAVINELVRLYALANEITVPTTLGRLNQLVDQSAITAIDANNLRDVWLFLNRMRWRHQLKNHVTDNFVIISDLTSIEKHQLKAAFQAIKRAQQIAVMKFAGGMAA